MYASGQRCRQPPGLVLAARLAQRLALRLTHQRAFIDRQRQRAPSHLGPRDRVRPQRARQQRNKYGSSRQLSTAARAAEQLAAFGQLH